MNILFYLSSLKPRVLCLKLTFIFFSVVAFAQEAKIDSSSLVTLRIDPQSARGAAVSRIFDEVKFIPLETNRESLFGNINDLKIVKNHFVIFDYDTRAVLIFNQGGKFNGKIDASRIPKDPGDKSKTELYGYRVVEENKDTLIAIAANKYWFYFDLTGKQIKKLPSKELDFREEIKFADQETSLRQGYLEKKSNDSTYYEFAILRKNKDTVGYFPFSKKRYELDDFWDGGKIYNYGVPNELFFIGMHQFNIYKVKPSGLSMAYQIILPAVNSLPKDFLENPIYRNKRGEYFQVNPKVFYSMYSTYQIGDYLYLQMRNWGWGSEVKKAIIYHLKTGELTSIQDLEPDSLSSLLPVTDATQFHDFNNRGFHLYKDGYFYTSYSSLAMFTFKEQLGNKNNNFSPVMTEYFKTQSRKSNPVIIQLKPKH